jgi:hypothetical protein
MRCRNSWSIEEEIRSLNVKQYFKQFCLSLGSLFIVACASLGTKPGSLKLEAAATIKPGVSTKAEIENVFGKPHRIFRLEEYPEQSDDGEVWTYYEEPSSKSGRLSFYFKKGALVTSSVGWNVRDTEPEQNLDRAKTFIEAQFPNVNFQQRDEGWAHLHSYSDNSYFEDPKLGVAISYRMKRKEVTGISWSDPKLYTEMVQKQQRRLACLTEDCSKNNPR